jgi:hypothetical protein
MDVDKNTATKRFGKYFCGEDHANQYAEMKIQRDMKRRDMGGGGCC